MAVFSIVARRVERPVSLRQSCLARRVNAVSRFERVEAIRDVIRKCQVDRGQGSGLQISFLASQVGREVGWNADVRRESAVNREAKNEI